MRYQIYDRLKFVFSLSFRISKLVNRILFIKFRLVIYYFFDINSYTKGEKKMNEKRNTIGSSPYETMDRYNKMMLDFIDKYKGVDLNTSEVKGSINKYNIDLVRMINDYIVKYKYFNRIEHVIQNYIYHFWIDETEGNDKYLFRYVFNNIKRISGGVRSTSRIYYRLKSILKKVPIDQSLYKAIKQCCLVQTNRLDRLIENILPEYINITPLYDFMKILEKEGVDIFDYIIESVPLGKYNSNNFDDMDEDITSLIEVINELTVDKFEWKENLNKYKELHETRKKLAAESKEHDKMKEKKRKAESVQNVLYQKASDLQKNYDRSFQAITGGKGTDSKAKHDLLVLKEEAIYFKEENHCDDVKILLLAHVRKSNCAVVKYYRNKQGESYFADSIKFATLLKLDDPIPEDIQKKVDNYDLVFHEFIL